MSQRNEDDCTCTDCMSPCTVCGFTMGVQRAAFRQVCLLCVRLAALLAKNFYDIGRHAANEYELDRLYRARPLLAAEVRAAHRLGADDETLHALITS
jgi:hypothetical protein